MGGWHLRMTWGQEVCYASLHSEPASPLGMPTVWSLWGNPGWLGVERCQLCLQDTSHRAKWHRWAAVGHWVSLCVWSVVGWLIVYQDGDYLYTGQYSQTICRSLIKFLKNLAAICFLKLKFKMYTITQFFFIEDSTHVFSHVKIGNITGVKSWFISCQDW